MEQNLHNPHHRLLYLLIALSLVALGVGTYVLRTKGLSQQSKIAVETTPAPESSQPQKPKVAKIDPNASVLRLQGKLDQVRFAQGQIVQIAVVADSKKKPVVGYDAIVAFDKNAFSYLGATSVLAGYTIFPFPQDATISITGIKPITQKEGAVLDNQEIATFQFQPLKRGIFIFSLIKKEGKATTKLVSEKRAVLTPQLHQLQVEIY